MPFAYWMTGLAHKYFPVPFTPLASGVPLTGDTTAVSSDSTLITADATVTP